jgi:AcrR family transcriptional regulator
MAVDPQLVLPPAERPPDGHPPAPRAAARRDGEASRERLLLAALSLFAQHGYARASTRDIAVAAGTNVAAIAYYFGDKAGLYRAVFEGPMPMSCRMPDEAAGAAGLPDMLRDLYAGYMEPLKQGDLARQCLKLQMRELIDPTGIWPSSLVDSVKPVHEWLVATLSRHLGLAGPDDDVRRLAICIAALGVHQHVACDVIGAIAPQLTRDDAAFDAWVDRLVLYGTAMVDAERMRRARAAKAPS